MMIFVPFAKLLGCLTFYTGGNINFGKRKSSSVLMECLEVMIKASGKTLLQKETSHTEIKIPELAPAFVIPFKATLLKYF